MSQSRLAILLFCFFSFLSGCSFIHTNRGTSIDKSALEAVQPSVHFSTVLETLGPPAKVTAHSSGFAFLYEYLHIREAQLGIGSQQKFLEWFKFSISRGTADRETLVLIFNKEGRLVAHAYDEDRDNLGTGGAIQFITGVRSLIDKEHFTPAMDPHTWGMAMLRPLPQTLNNEQSLYTGQSGFEQTGTKSKVGQHSLEMR